METINLWALFNPLESFLEKSILSSKYWKIRVLFFSCLFSFTWLFVFNKGYLFENFKFFYADVILHKPQPYFYWNSIIEQGEAPFVFRQHESGSHEANRIYRLTIPMIAHYLHLNSLGLYLLQVLLGAGFLYMLINVLAKILDDKLLTFYLFFAFVNVYVGSCFFFNCFGHGDGYTFFFMLCALVVRRPLLIALFCQLAFWCDERSIVAFMTLWLFHHFFYKLDKKESLKVFLLMAGNVVLYLILRLYLGKTYHLASEDVENFSLDRYMYFINLTSWWYGKRTSVAVEGFALLIIMVFLVLYHDRLYRRILLVFGSWMPVVAVSFLVWDTVRTYSFTFAFWLIALIILKERLNGVQFKALALMIAFVNLLIPITFP